MLIAAIDGLAAMPPEPEHICTAHGHQEARWDRCSASFPNSLLSKPLTPGRLQSSGSRLSSPFDTSLLQGFFSSSFCLCFIRTSLPDWEIVQALSSRSGEQDKIVSMWQSFEAVYTSATSPQIGCQTH